MGWRTLMLAAATVGVIDGGVSADFRDIAEHQPLRLTGKVSGVAAADVDQGQQ